MPRSDPALLSLTRLALRALVGLNLLIGALILAMLAASLVAETQFLVMLGARAERGAGADPGDAADHAGRHRRRPARPCRADPAAGDRRHGRRRRSVRGGNAARLQTIAWALLGLELLHLAGGAIAALASSPADPLDIGWSFSFTGWLAVLLLFVLARVFDHGARMREDLEGTI